MAYSTPSPCLFLNIQSDIFLRNWKCQHSAVDIECSVIKGIWAGFLRENNNDSDFEMQLL